MLQWHFHRFAAEIICHPFPTSAYCCIYIIYIFTYIYIIICIYMIIHTYIYILSPSYYIITWYYISFTSQFSDTIFPPKSHQLFPSFPHILIQRQTPWRPAAPGGPGTVAPVPVLVRGAAVAASPPGMARCWDLDFFVFFFARKNGDSTNNNGDLTWFNMI